MFSLVYTVYRTRTTQCYLSIVLYIQYPVPYHQCLLLISLSVFGSNSEGFKELNLVSHFH